jgi:hypothetical protein
VEVDDLPIEKVSPVALGDRSSPDGFEWPDCPVTPPLKRCFSPLYRRPPSPYDNVPPVEPVVRTPWGLDALRSLDSPVGVAAAAAACDEEQESDDNSSEEEEKGIKQGQTLTKQQSTEFFLLFQTTEDNGRDQCELRLTSEPETTTNGERYSPVSKEKLILCYFNFFSTIFYCRA